MLNNINNKWLGLLLISLLALTGCATTGSELAGSATDITRESNAALQDLYASNPEARQLARRAKGVLVFPSIVKAGFLVGAQYGTGGALFKKGRTAGYYNIAAASYGLQAGVQSFSYVFIPGPAVDFRAILEREKARMKLGQRFLRGVFAGGTFCYQAQQILQDAGVRVYSNSPLEGNQKLPDPSQSREHTLVDMGADEFTSGRPHPMIDSSQRRERILDEARDPGIAVLLLDFILGFNASADPAGELIPAITQAKEEVRRKGGFLSVVASVSGTEEYSQGFTKQVKLLEGAGAVVFPSSAQSAEFCAALIQSRLGLAIVQEIAQLHGASLEIESPASGHGTLVTALFPASPA